MAGATAEANIGTMPVPEKHRVDVDEQPDLAERFSVADVPTLVLVKGKRVVDRIDGRASAPKIENMLEPHLAGAAA